MEEERRTQVFYLNACRVGLLLLALVVTRALSVHQDALSLALGIIGFSLVVAHMRSVEKKLDITKTHRLVSSGIFVIILVPLAYWLS